MSQPRTLIVDDERHIRVLMKTVISGIGGEVVAEAANGKEAVEAYGREKPDLVLMDINMPIMDGKEALAAIMAEDSDASVIMLTSLADMETIKECVELGATHYIRKDTPLTELRATLTEVWQEVSQG